MVHKLEKKRVQRVKAVSSIERVTLGEPGWDVSAGIGSESTDRYTSGQASQYFSRHDSMAATPLDPLTLGKLMSQSSDNEDNDCQEEPGNWPKRPDKQTNKKQIIRTI